MNKIPMNEIGRHAKKAAEQIALEVIAGGESDITTIIQHAVNAAKMDLMKSLQAAGESPTFAAFEAGFGRGERSEREAVVAWLRRIDDHDFPDAVQYSHSFAEAIEAGMHLKGGGDDDSQG